MKQKSLKRDLGIITATSIVIGNMIGSGFFKAPSQLARINTPAMTIFAWVVSIIGIMFITWSYGNLATKYPRAGGPVAYAEEAMGKFGGFTVSWIWWVTSWIGNAAIVTLAALYLGEIIPALNNENAQFVIKVSLISIFTIINLMGVKEAGRISLITTILKLSVFIGFGLIGIFFIDINNYQTVSQGATEFISENSTNPQLAMFSSAFIIIMWAFTGIESATLTGGEIKNPEKNIKRSTILGVAGVSFIYLVISIIMMGVLSQEELASTVTPFSTGFQKIVNNSAIPVELFINIAILISIIGALSGWFLTTARSAYAAAINGYFPKLFSEVNQKQTPSKSIIISGLLTLSLIVVTYVANIIIGDPQAVSTEFDNITYVAAFFNLPTYLTTVISEIIILKREKTIKISSILRLSIALIVSIVFIYFGYLGTTVPLHYWIFSLIAILIGIPIFINSLRENAD